MIEKNQMNRPPMVTATLLRRLSMVMSSSYFSTGANPASAHSLLYRLRSLQKSSQSSLCNPRIDRQPEDTGISLVKVMDLTLSQRRIECDLSLP